MRTKRFRVVVSLAVCGVLLLTGGIFYAHATSSNWSTGDQVFDEILAANGIEFQTALDQPSRLTETEAIQAATEQYPSFAEKATQLKAELVVYCVGEAEERPVWLVTLDGVAGPSRGPRSESDSAPYPIAQTMILIDPLTGDVVSMGYMSHK